MLQKQMMEESLIYYCIAHKHFYNKIYACNMYTYSCCIHLRDHFTWNYHPCFVFKLYGPSVYTIMSKNGYRPFPDNIVRDLAVQICSSIQCMQFFCLYALVCFLFFM